MRRLVLIGGGGHCKSVLDSILRLNLYDDIVILDRESNVGNSILGYRVIGTDDMLQTLSLEGYKDAFITVGSIKNTSLRRKLFDKTQQFGYRLINIIDPTAVLSNNIDMGDGIFIGKRSIVNVDVQIGNMAIINSGAIIEHECMIGEYTHISVGAVLCGKVNVGNDTFVGANATVIQGIDIESNCIIGAGSTILSSVCKDMRAIGVHKK